MDTEGAPGARRELRKGGPRGPRRRSAAVGGGPASVAHEAKVGPGEPEPPSRGGTEDERQDRTVCDQR